MLQVGQISSTRSYLEKKNYLILYIKNEVE